MHSGYIAILAIAMFIACKCRNEFVHHIIDVAEAQRHIGIIHLNGKTISDIITESSYSRVIVGSTPLTEEVGITIYQLDFAEVQ